MVDRDKQQTDEFKKANSKIVTVGGEKKLLLMDDDEPKNSDEEIDLQEIIETLVREALEENELYKDYNKKKLCEGYIDEAEFPNGFNIEEFNKISSFKNRVSYAKKHLQRVAGGSGRVVFVVDPETVVKIALNKKGQAQNSAEWDISNMGYSAVTKVKNADTDKYLYLEVERAKKLNMRDWKKVTGWNFYDWMAVLRNYVDERFNKKRARNIVPKDFEKIEESELFLNTVQMITDFDMPAGDIQRPSSWGIVKRDGAETPVLVDYGLTGEVYKSYYK